MLDTARLEKETFRLAVLCSKKIMDDIKQGRLDGSLAWLDNIETKAPSLRQALTRKHQQMFTSHLMQDEAGFEARLLLLEESASNFDTKEMFKHINESIQGVFGVSQATSKRWASYFEEVETKYGLYQHQNNAINPHYLLFRKMRHAKDRASLKSFPFEVLEAALDEAWVSSFKYQNETCAMFLKNTKDGVFLDFPRKLKDVVSELRPSQEPPPTVITKKKTQSSPLR